jgi:hypothetical protein
MSNQLTFMDVEVAFWAVMLGGGCDGARIEKREKRKEKREKRKEKREKRKEKREKRKEKKLIQ